MVKVGPASSSWDVYWRICRQIAIGHLSNSGDPKNQIISRFKILMYDYQGILPIIIVSLFHGKNQIRKKQHSEKGENKMGAKFPVI